MTTPTLVFLNTETTSLRPDRRIWEIGAIVRPAGAADATTDLEHRWFIDIDDLDLGNADPISLKIGGFYDRYPRMLAQFPVGQRLYSEKRVMSVIEQITRGAWIIGAVVNFDTEAMSNRMRWHGVAPSWHYHLGDVESMAAGALGIRPPWGFDDILAKLGLKYDEKDRHTALGDARMARDLYDRIFDYRTRVNGMIEQAFNLLANVGVHVRNQGWDSEHPEWREAAEKWRDNEYHPWLRLNYPPNERLSPRADGRWPDGNRT